MNMTDAPQNGDARANAQSWSEDIQAMLTAVEVDYDLLEELASADADELDDKDREQLAQLRAEACECESQDDAMTRIYESPLSVQVRSGWVAPGAEMEAEEFEILLTTGGPALRIRGDLDQHGQPSRAYMEYQGWGTPWMQYFQADSNALLQYAGYFFG